MGRPADVAAVARPGALLGDADRLRLRRDSALGVLGSLGSGLLGSGLLGSMGALGSLAGSKEREPTS